MLSKEWDKTIKVLMGNEKKMRFLWIKVLNKVESFLWYIRVWISDVPEKSFLNKDLEKKAWLSENK